MTNELSTKRAALELIEAEKQRRIDLKMASGEAIWGPPLILVSRVPDKETLPDGENAAVVVERDDATGREVYREVIRIVTGVPRRERDSDGAAALAQPRTNDKMLRFVRSEPAEPPRAPLPRPTIPEFPTEEVRRSICCTVRLPKPEKGDPGQIMEGSYSLSDGVLRVYDEDGRMLVTSTLKPGDDAVHAARKILREKHGRHGAFYDPIPYGRPTVF